MPILRKRQIENLEQLSGEELAAFLDSLPAGQATIAELLDHVEDELYETECDHSLRHAMRFMMEKQLNFGKITSWLNDNGHVARRVQTQGRQKCPWCEAIQSCTVGQRRECRDVPTDPLIGRSTSNRLSRTGQ